MSSGTFGYPLCFSAMFAVMGLFVSSLETVPVVPAAERAAYQEILKLYQDENCAAIRKKSERFMVLYPDSIAAEAVATYFGESLVKSGNWKEDGPYYRRLEARFPKSINLDRFVFLQALAYFHAANLTESALRFDRFLKQFPNSPCVEYAHYCLAMSNFLSNNYKETLVAAAGYLRKYPDGEFAGDLRYRQSFIDFNDKEKDQSAKITRELSEFIKDHPDDLVIGSMYCLMADTYKRMEKPDEALDSYIQAVWTKSPDDVIQYALDSAAVILRERKDWSGIAKLYSDFKQRNPDSLLTLDQFGGKGPEAAELLVNSLKTRIADPSNEQVDLLIDEVVKAFAPRKKPDDIDALDKQLVEIFNKAIGDMGNPTTDARVFYARARLAKLLRLSDRSDHFLKEIANAKDLSALSPALLVICGEFLLNTGDVDGAEAMYQRLRDHFPEANCRDVGAVGLGFVALARKTPKEALAIFEDALKKAENSRFKEATIGKLEALADLDQLEIAVKLAMEIIGGREFRGELSAKAYLQLVRIYRKQADKVERGEAIEWLKKAHGICQRVYVTYQAFPELCAEGYMQAFETAKQLGADEIAEDALKALKDHPKLKNTKAFKKAMMMK